jgi:hypothetical protein
MPGGEGGPDHFIFRKRGQGDRQRSGQRIGHALAKPDGAGVVKLQALGEQKQAMGNGHFGILQERLM